MTLLNSLLALSLGMAGPAPKPPKAPVEIERFRAVLHSPGGKLPFFLEISKGGNPRRAWIINGPERIEIPTVASEGRALWLEFDHYDSYISATGIGDGRLPDSNLPLQFRGTWQKVTGIHTSARMDFTANCASGTHRFDPLVGKAGGAPSAPPITGRWAVRFSKSGDPAVGIFEAYDDGIVHGTFLTTLGDYRYLAGRYEHGRLRLSCFDGAHAFLFDAAMSPDGTLEGEFWSRDSWSEKWTAKRDASAALRDPFKLTQWNESKSLKELRFRDLDGRLRSPEHADFKGKARIIKVFGSWCPNCHDAAAYMVELDRRYRSRGLSILGLAFEMTGNFKRDARQVRRFIQRHGIEYPILLAGLSDKAAASKAFPVLDRVRSYPTTILLDADGKVHAIHTGFSGPATGEAHQKLRREFESRIETLLTREPTPFKK